MSAIYFHAHNGDAEVCGEERAHFGNFCNNLSWAILGGFSAEYGKEESILRQLFPHEHYVHNGDFSKNIKRVLSGNLTESLSLNGSMVDIFGLHLNTAMSMGSDFIKLAARLHGQCEIHAYVEGENRDWLAEIITRGRESKFYRDDMGWESVVELLEKDNTTPIVTSYSVCARFPNSSVANYEYPIVDGEENRDAWNDLPYENQWELGIAGLRKSRLVGLELRPGDWNRFYFSSGMNANELIDKLRKARCGKNNDSVCVSGRQGIRSML